MGIYSKRFADAIGVPVEEVEDYFNSVKSKPNDVVESGNDVIGMKREEAIKYIEEWLKDEYALNNRDRAVLQMAIEALQAKTDGDLISRQAAIDAIKKINAHGNSDRANGIGLAKNAIILLQSAEPPYQYSEAYVNQLRGERDFLQDMVDTMAERLAEPKTKCIAQIRIDRDDIEDMVNEKVNEMEVNMAEPKTGRDCTDFIRWLMDEVMDEENWHLNAVANGEVICRKLKKLGLLDVVDGYYVETQKTGKWVKAVNDGVVIYADAYAQCDQCHGVTFNGWVMDYCPNCGSYNGGEKSE